MNRILELRAVANQAPTLDRLAQCIVDSGVAPNIAVGCARKRGGTWVQSSGGEISTHFDIASLTKPIFAVAFASSHLDRSSRLDSLLHDAAGRPAGSATMTQLLAHRAGLLPHAVLAKTPSTLRAVASLMRENIRDGAEAASAPPVYSDLGYILAAAAFNSARGGADMFDVGDAIDALVAKPLDLQRSLGSARLLKSRGIQLKTTAAPTGNASTPSLRIAQPGEVHDDNAWALSGEGCSGHAGLFATVDAVVAFGCALLDAMQGDRAHWGDIAWLAEGIPQSVRRIGFDGKSRETSSAGTLASDATFGHLGFTGTSFWIDPDRGAVTAFLSNRVAVSASTAMIREARPIVHDALFSHATSM